MLMDSVAMVTRGWPNDGALDRPEVIAAGKQLKNGDWVVKTANSSVTAAPAASATNFPAGLVIEGNADSSSSVNSGKALVLWSNFIANISNYDATASYVPGSPLMVSNGILTLATGSFPVVAWVLDVVTAALPGTSQYPTTAHLTVLVK